MNFGRPEEVVFRTIPVTPNTSGCERPDGRCKRTTGFPARTALGLGTVLMFIIRTTYFAYSSTLTLTIIGIGSMVTRTAIFGEKYNTASLVDAIGC